MYILEDRALCGLPDCKMQHSAVYVYEYITVHKCSVLRKARKRGYVPRIDRATPRDFCKGGVKPGSYGGREGYSRPPPVRCAPVARLPRATRS